jgi:hypothetical protein
MSLQMSDITLALTDVGVPTYEGYAPSGAALPYVVQRPLLVDYVNLAVTGDAVDWSLQFTVYCCGASVSASFNIALAVMQRLHGQVVGGSVIAASMGYSGAQVEGHYESQVTIQINQGGIS